MPRPSTTGVRGLYRDAAGRYRIDLRWIDPRLGPQRFKERLPDGLPAAAAKKHAQDILAAAFDGTLAKLDPKVPRTLSGAFDEYLKCIRADLGERAHIDRKTHATHWVETIGNVSLEMLSPFLLEKFKTKRRGEGLEPATINRHLATLKHMVGRASSWGWIPKDRAADIRAVKLLKEPPGRVRYLSDEERRKLDAVLPREFKQVVMAALFSGLRLSNVVRLRKESVDLPARTITLVRMKNNKVHRVPINETLEAVLREALARSKCEYVFVNRHGKPYTGSGGSSFFRKLVERAGIEDFHFHDLRHDYATRLRRKRVDIDAISTLLGHSSLAMTTRYAHIDDPTLRDAVASLDAPPAPEAAKTVAPALPSTPQTAARKGAQ